MTRKRWPAIEPHWRVLWPSGGAGDRWDKRQSAYSFVALLKGCAVRPVAIIKVTPK